MVQPTWSGVPNALAIFLPFNGTSFSIGTWNTRGLLCSNRQQRNRKLEELTPVLGHTSVLCLQETHGNPAQVNSFLSDLTGRFLFFHSPFLDPLYHGGVDPMLDSGCDFEFDSDGKKIIKATGGLITLVNRNLASLTNCNFEIIIPGRATRLTIFALGKVSVTFNIHNERLTSSQFLSPENRILAEIVEARSNHIVFRSILLAT